MKFLSLLVFVTLYGLSMHQLLPKFTYDYEQAIKTSVSKIQAYFSNENDCKNCSEYFLYECPIEFENDSKYQDFIKKLNCSITNLNFTDTTKCDNQENISAIKVNDQRGVFSIANLDDFNQTHQVDTIILNSKKLLCAGQ